MISSDYTRGLLVRESDTKILLMVLDGLGGLPHPQTGRSELETASLPNFDALATRSSRGFLSPLGPGFTPGSGPAHLALFGYDPWRNTIGRGALSALGLGVDFAPGDVASRINFCTVDEAGRVVDRRAGRIPTDKCRELCRMLEGIRVPEMQIFITPEMEHRAVVLFRGEGLADGVTDSDPQMTAVLPRSLEGSARTVEVANSFLDQAAELLRGETPANMVLIRGFGSYPRLSHMDEVYGLRAAAIAGYPMYRGVARAVGMEAVQSDRGLASAVAALKARWEDFDFFYIHVKETDRAGEDADFDGKVRLLEEVDAHIPEILGLEPDVVVVTGDHSTPSIMGGHSWHPVPVVISSRWSRPDPGPAEFTETGCLGGSIGQIPSTSLMALALAHARRLNKLGA